MKNLWVLGLFLFLAACGDSGSRPSTTPPDPGVSAGPQGGGTQVCQKGEDCWVFIQDVSIADWQIFLEELAEKKCPESVSDLEGQSLAGAHIVTALERIARIPDEDREQDWRAIVALYELTFSSSCHLKPVTADELQKRIMAKYK